MLKYLIILFFLISLPAKANVRGSDLHNFNPLSSGLDFITVHSSRTLDPLQFNAGTFINYTTNSLSYSTVSGAPNNQAFTEPNDRLLYSNIQFGIGITEGFEIGFASGFINSQDIDQSNFLFSYGDTGINDIMLTAKKRILERSWGGMALILGADFDQIKNNPFSGENAGPSFNFEGALDYRINPRTLWAINLGYRFRQEGATIPNTGVTPMSDQFVYSTALSYKTDDKGSAIITELFGSFPTEEFTLPTDRQISNLELIGSYRWRHSEAFDFIGGLGTEVYHGFGSPDIRIFIGFNFKYDFSNSTRRSSPYTIYQPLKEISVEKPDTDQDGDGIVDQLDQCAGTTPGDRVNAYGCSIYSSPNE